MKIMTPGIKRQVESRIVIRCQEWRKLKLRREPSNLSNKRTPISEGKDVSRWMLRNQEESDTKEGCQILKSRMGNFTTNRNRTER